MKSDLLKPKRNAEPCSTLRFFLGKFALLHRRLRHFDQLRCRQIVMNIKRLDEEKLLKSSHAYEQTIALVLRAPGDLTSVMDFRKGNYFLPVVELIFEIH